MLGGLFGNRIAFRSICFKSGVTYRKQKKPLTAKDSLISGFRDTGDTVISALDCVLLEASLSFVSVATQLKSL